MPYSNVASAVKRVLELLAEANFNSRKLAKLKKEFSALLITGHLYFEQNSASDLATLYSSKKLIPGLRDELDTILAGLQKGRISEAIWLHHKLNVSEHKIFKKYPINSRDWNEIESCIAESGFTDKEFSDLISSIWHEQFEELEMGCEVIFDEKALDDLLISTIEGYLSPKKKMRTPYEVFGLCLGTRTEVESPWFYKEIIYVAKCPPQISAETNNKSCVPMDKSYDALKKVRDYLFPQYKIVGEYHSHPYKDLKELHTLKGWKNSEQDAARWDWCKSVGSYGDLQFALIVSISQLKRNARAGIKLRQPNHLFFNLDDLRIHLYAKRILSTGKLSDHNIQIRTSKMMF